MNSDKFCLQWNDFQKNIVSSIQELRGEKDFSDVTLVCEDNQQVEAHRVILSTASNFFKTMLTGNKHSHPLIYMRGIKSDYLVSIIDFIYHGEVNINQDDLDDFLQIAAELKLKGLSVVSSESDDKSPLKTQQKPIPPNNIKPKKQSQNTKNIIRNENTIDHVTIDISDQIDEIKPIVPVNNMINLSEGTIAAEAKVSVSFRDENPELDEIISSMLEKADGLWKCTRCGKTSKDKTQVKRHIEKHIEGITHPCGYCGVYAKTRNALQVHFYKNHTS